jgi:hypothetical protein
MPADKLKFHLTGSGAMSVDQKAMPDISKLNPTDMMKDQKAIFKLIAEAIPQVAADLQFSLEVPPEVLKMAGNTKLPNPLKLNLRLVDGVMYVKTRDLATFMPQVKHMPEWMGVNLPDVMTAIVNQPEFNVGMGSMSSSMGTSSNMMQMFNDPKVLGGFVKIERLADAEVDSHKVAVFKTTLDYPELFNLPFMQDMITQQMKAAGAKLSDKEIKAVMGQIQGMAKGMQFSSTKSIDLESKYVHLTEINMVFDFSSMKAQIGSAPVITLDATVRQADFNSVPTITVPKGGVDNPVESLMPSE